MSCVYGPVPSWRLGRSLGIDPLGGGRKTCSFNCTYCQLGDTTRPLTVRRAFISPESLEEELRRVAARRVVIDTATFSGIGEPTLALNLADLVPVVRRILPGIPVAILTNSALLPEEQVRQELLGFDIVVAKLDAPTEALFQAVNRPFTRYTLAQTVEGIRLFRAAYRGKLALQMMCVGANRGTMAELAALARELRPEEIQLNTPLRPGGDDPLPRTEMEALEGAFAGLPVVNVYRAPRIEAPPIDLHETRRRRPERR